MARVWKAPPKVTMSQWADENRRLSSEASFEPGRWRTSRAQYQRGIMDACSDPTIQDAVVMSSAQVGKSEILLNCIGYFAQYDPAPMLLVQPTIKMAEDFSKDRVAPMIRDTPCLTAIFGDGSRETANTITNKAFPGGNITIIGANSPTDLAGRPKRIILFDEVDRAPVSAGTEGDPIGLAEKRANNFPNRKRIKVSTPTVKGFSRIEAAWLESDQRRYFVPCPHCGYCHPLYWGNVVFPNGPASAMLKCPACGGTFNDAQKNEAVRHAAAAGAPRRNSTALPVST
jgi:phage terminase large subunit GpA-like protein